MTMTKRRRRLEMALAELTEEEHHPKMRLQMLETLPLVVELV